MCFLSNLLSQRWPCVSLRFSPYFYRLNLPKKKKKPDHEDEERDNSMKCSNSAEQLDVDGDNSSEVSSEINFSYEYAQMEVTMKALGSNGKKQQKLLEICTGMDAPFLEVFHLGWGPEQPHLVPDWVVGNPACCREVGIRWSLGSLRTQACEYEVIFSGNV